MSEVEKQLLFICNIHFCFIIWCIKKQPESSSNSKIGKMTPAVSISILTDQGSVACLFTFIVLL